MATYSHTRLETYTKCGEYYRLYYLDKSVPRPNTKSVPLVAGDVTHQALEDFYGAGERMSLGTSLENVWFGILAKAGLLDLQDDLSAVMADTSALRVRAGKDYAGPNPIRTEKGTVARSPSMTSDWRRAAAELGLDARKERVDRAAAKALPDPYNGVSLCEAYEETWIIIQEYGDPLAQFTVTSNEKMFNRKLGDISVTGKIDIVARHPEHGLTIIDHKTSNGEAPDYVKIGNLDQLLLYGLLWYEEPQTIAVNHVRTNTLVLAPWSRAKADAAAERVQKRVEAIEQQIFIPRSPTDFQSPCYNERTKVGCPYLPNCHPIFFAEVNA